MVNRELEFTFDGGPVGIFDEAKAPEVAGRYRYVPFRSLAHRELHRALKAGLNPRCAMVQHPGVSFTVVASPQYGVLELSDVTVDAQP